MYRGSSGGALPRHHVLRPRLLGELRPARAALVVAGGGYGKTLLGLELAQTLGLATVSVGLAATDLEPAAVVARLIAALRRARLTDAAGAVHGARADPAAAIDALAGVLARERDPVLVVVDDAHFAGPEAAVLLARLAARLPHEHRLLVLARHAPAALETLRQGAAIVLGAEQLAFSAPEAATLAGAFGVSLGASDAEDLRRATAGWAAALVLAAERIARAADPEQELAAIVEQQRTLRYLVSRQLDELTDAARGAAVQLAHLPLLSPEVAAAVTGEAAAFEQLGAAGVPLSLRADGWWELPGPVQDMLAGIEPLRPRTALAAAPVYARAGELSDALHLLLKAGEAEAAAALVAGIPSRAADDLGYLELQTLIDALPPQAVERQPGLLLHLARTCEPAAQVRLRADALRRARSLLEHRRDAAGTRAVDAEIARDLVRDGRDAEAQVLAARVLAETSADEPRTRARVIDVLGRAAAWRREDSSLVEAERLLREAFELCRALGERRWASQVLMPLAHGVYYARGEHERALELIEQELDVLPSRSPHRGVILSFYGDTLIDCGRFADAEPVVEEGRRLGSLLSDHRIAAYAAWTGARLASQTGDAGRTVREVREADRHRGDWFEHSTGVDFSADAADLLDRVGEHELALEYLDRARPRRDESPLAVAIAEAALLARSGDPEAAVPALAALGSIARLAPRERWRVALLGAYAALRAGDGRAGALAADAFEQAAALGKPRLPLWRDRELAERLVGLAAAAGSRAAAELEVGGRPLTVSVLGGFELRRAGEPIALPPGKPAQLVKLLAISGGRLPAELAIEELWPEVGPDSGRKRLRNVLNRLHATVPDVVARDGRSLALGEVEVDADLFERAARGVLGRMDVGAPRLTELSAARLAITRYRGSLLPDDRYEPWAAGPRERLERLFASLVDAAADAAHAIGEVDEALRNLERGLEIDPFDEARYLRGAQLLLEQGRRGAAAALLERGERAIGRLGVPVSRAHRELAASLRSATGER